jgi:hypothetical protein
VTIDDLSPEGKSGVWDVSALEKTLGECVTSCRLGFYAQGLGLQ